MPERRSGRVLSSLYDWVEALVWALMVIVLLFLFVVRVVQVDGESMHDTLQDGDRLVLRVVAYTPDYQDIVVVNRYTDEPLIKRVIALSGDTVYIDPDTGILYVNGEPQQENYVHYPNLTYDLHEEVTVPAGHVFVMGDHRNNSKDSRSREVGFVNVKDIVGKVVFRYWPIRELGGVYDNL